MRDLRGRVKAARAVVATTQGLAETLAGDWQKAALFYARFGITEATLGHGVPGNELAESETITGLTRSESLIFSHEVT